MKSTIQEIVASASEVIRIEAHQITNGDRSDLHCRPRFAVCLIAHDLGYSHPRIGRVLGGRDHTSIINACRCAKDLAAEDEEYVGRIDSVRSMSRREVIPVFKLQRNGAV